MDESGFVLPGSERIESLGDNCELGFTLRRLGCEDGMLFRWSSITPESLLATLRGNFEELYNFENLVAHRSSMVLDRRYGTAWHTEMRSDLVRGAWTFKLDEAARRTIHAAEQLKRIHLVGKLRRKFAHPNPVFVIKHNAGIPPDVLESLHYQLYRLVESPDFALLEVCADPGRAGEVDVLDRTLMRGYVSRFASYNDAELGDDASWRRVLSQALARGRSKQAPPRPTQEFADIILPFPVEHQPCLTQVMPGDLRTGMVSLEGGNDWCRLIEDDVFRLHAREIGPSATVLRWSGVHLPANFTMRLQATSAIPESYAVRATLEVERADGQLLETGRVVAPGSPGQIVLASDWDRSGPATVRLKVEPLAPIRGDGRAVIDLQPIICRREKMLQPAAATL